MLNLDDETQFIGLDDYEPVRYNFASPSDRFIAAFIDGIIIVVASNILGSLGVMVGIAYHLTKDALPFLKGQSIGKKIMRIRVLLESTGQPITEKYDVAITRGVPLLIPIFDIFDAVSLLNTDHKRIGDKWAKTIVIKEQDKANF